MLEAGPDDPDGQRGDGDAALVEHGEELRHPPTLLAEQVVGGDPAVVEGQAVGVRGVPAHLAVGRLDDQPVGAGGHEDGARLARPGAGGDRDERRDRRARVGDEGLLPVEHPLVAVEGGLRPQAAGVAAGVGLGQPEGGQRRPRAELGQPALLLGLGAEAVDGGRPQTDGGLQGDGQGLVDPGDLLDGDAQRGQVAATAAVLLGEGQPEQPQLAHLLDGVDREGVVPVPGLGVRCDLGVGEVPHQRTQRLLLGRGVEERHRGHGSGGCWVGRRAARPRWAVRRPPPPAAGGPPGWPGAAPR